QAHETLRFAVAFGLGHPEIMLNAGFRIRALLLPDDHRRATPEPADTSLDSIVFCVKPITGQRREILDQALDVVLEVRSVGMTRDQRLLPWRQFRVNLPETAIDL